jgi:signal transduction histidine kinase
VSNAGVGPPIDDLVDRLRADVLELRASRRRLAEAADGNRRAIERALHDGVQQHLVAFAVQLRRLTGLLENDPRAARALIDALAASVGAAIDETTDLAQWIYPPLLEAQGLAIALRAEAERAEVILLLDVTRSAGLPAEINAALYWSCLEALASAPAGSEARIAAFPANGGLAVEIEIGGRLTEERLDHVRDRIETLDGHVALEHRPDGGSRIQVWLPTSD